MVKNGSSPERSRENEVVIEVRGLSTHFGERIALHQFDLEVKRGEVFGFLGPNGAGKSTLMRILLGLMSPTEGTVKVLNYSIPKEAERLRDCVGYMTQKFSLYDDLSVKENLEFAAQVYGLSGKTKHTRVDFAIQEYGLELRRHQRPATMSGGWKQRLALAVSTIHEPELLFLDEPTAGVDPDSRRFFWSKLFDLAAQGTTILVPTHYMDEAVRCHRICMIREGVKTAIGHPAELVSALKTRVVELSCSSIENAIKITSKLPEVESVTQLGSQAHILLHPDAPPAAEAVVQLQKQLESAGLIHLRIRVAEPNLEDVFVDQCQVETKEENV